MPVMTNSSVAGSGTVARTASAQSDCPMGTSTGQKRFGLCLNPPQPPPFLFLSFSTILIVEPASITPPESRISNTVLLSKSNVGGAA